MPKADRPGSCDDCGVPETPPLSVIVPTRGGIPEIEPVLEALRPQVEATGTEVIVVGGPSEPPAPDWVHRIPAEEQNMPGLRLRGVQESTGEVIAIGEDHAVPRPDWCEALIRAHAENPDHLAVAGALVNATDATTVGRANFRWFASPFQPPLEPFYRERPPPASAISFKRDALLGLNEVGELEGGVMPRLCWAGQIAPDGRIVTDHHQDHGLRWSIINGYHGGRSTYGLRRPRMSWQDRRLALRQIVPNIVLRPIREARELGQAPAPLGEMVIVTLIAIGTAAGCALGILVGPGRSPERGC
jgi:hypothetical protein